MKKVFQKPTITVVKTYNKQLKLKLKFGLAIILHKKVITTISEWGVYSGPPSKSYRFYECQCWSVKMYTILSVNSFARDFGEA